MLSPEAIENDKKSGIPLVRVKSIFADPTFNCRGLFGASEVVELARDTAVRGLVEPIIVRPLWDNEKIQKAQGFEYSLIAGFRRHYAYRVNEAEVIPAIIRKVDSDFECRDLNAVENLQRIDLNMLQEAKSIQHYVNAGWNREEIGRRVSKSPGWVQMRAMLLELPEEIQLATAQGYITQEDVRELYKRRHNRNEMMELAGIIRDKRKAGQTKNVLARIKKKLKPLESKMRKHYEIQEMMERVREMSKGTDRENMVRIGDLFSEQGNSALTRLLAWCCGYANNMEAHTAVKKLADILGCEYVIPDMETF